MASRARRKIEQAAERQGYEIVRAQYDPITPLEMGDALGGWYVVLKKDDAFRQVGGVNVDGVVAEIDELGMEG